VGAFDAELLERERAGIGAGPGAADFAGHTGLSAHAAVRGIELGVDAGSIAGGQRGRTFDRATHRPAHLAGHAGHAAAAAVVRIVGAVDADTSAGDERRIAFRRAGASVADLSRTARRAALSAVVRIYA